MTRVERETTVAAPAQDVWRALTDQELLKEWLAPEVELEPEEGGEVYVRVRVVETAPAPVGGWGPRLCGLARATALALA